MKLKKHLKEMLITLLLISLTTTGYAIVSTVVEGQPLTIRLWNEMKDIVNSNETKLEGVSNVGGNVGIGTTSPGTGLHVRTSGSSGQTPTNVAGIFIENGGVANNSYVFQTATSGGNTSFSITNAGNVGIGTTGPQAKVHIKNGLLFLERNGNIPPTCNNDYRGLMWTCDSSAGGCPNNSCPSHSGIYNDHIFICLRITSSTFEWNCIK